MLLTEPGIIARSMIRPPATGGFLSAAWNNVHELNPEAVMRAFGQELNPESYAICKGDMLIKGQDVSRIKLGQHAQRTINCRATALTTCSPIHRSVWTGRRSKARSLTNTRSKGFDGRFGPGLPRVSDGSLLFLMHLISKMRDYDANDPNKNGGRIGIILNGSPLFTGGAGSGESEIRRHILESDLLEAIVRVATDMFYNTGIATYVWILSNKKESKRKGRSN